MAKKKVKKTTTVHEHLLHVPPSKKNPTGITVRHQHARRIYESTDSIELKNIFASYKKSKIPYPTAGRLSEFKDSDRYDDLIAVWCDYFNKKFPPNPPLNELDPDIIKALIASESGFQKTTRNPKAFGITQITPQTLEILQDPDGEAKSYLFKDIRQKDLDEPEIAIPMAIRWLFRKQETAANSLNRTPTPEEIILEYKGLLKSKTDFKNKALISFRKAYEKLKSK